MKPILQLSLGAAALLALSACGSKQESGGKNGKGAQSGPHAIGYVVVNDSSVAVPAQLAGRTVAYESSDVRPQVNGLIRQRFFTEGSLVTKGQTLYEIDPRPYQASVNQARANLESARATAEAAQIKADRYRPLADQQAVAKQDYTDAAATAREAAASIDQNRAMLDTALINLHFTRVPAPISGRIGRSLYTVGALVTSSQTDPLATIQRLDPIYVDIQQSSTELLTLRRNLASGGVLPATAQVYLKLEDGSTYAQTGKVDFAEVVVDQSTGSVTLRATFANPQGILLPGMFVRAIFNQGVNPHAFLVPQQGLNRDPKGNATVMIVGPNNKAVLRDVTADRTQGAFWVVTTGLKAGDKVIVQGLLNLEPNMPVKPYPANSPQVIKPPKKQDGKSGSGGGSGGGKQGKGG